MTLAIDVQGLTVRFGDVTAVDDLTFNLDGDKIYGLLGRNGSGKTTLLSVLAAFRKPTAGGVTVGGEVPFENPRVMPQVCFTRETPDLLDSDRVQTTLQAAEFWRPNWDAKYAETLVERFGLPLRARVGKLSRGMKSALNVTIGLASRAPVTIFDEAYLGLDAPSRYMFYEELLVDYMARPRTIIVSTHLIEEVSSLFEEVLIIHGGGLVMHEEAETLRSRGVSIVGPADAVDRLTRDMTILGEQQLGPTKSIAVYGPLDDELERRAQDTGVELGPIALQDLFVHLTKNQRELV